MKTKEQIRKNMQSVRCRDSDIEILLRKALWSRGVRYRKNLRTVFGCPDLVITKSKIAVFADSEFWHGYDFKVAKKAFKSNADFWIPKIERNINRDKEVNKVLTDQGWTVIRFWGKDIKKDLEGCVKKILMAVNLNEHKIN